MSLHKQPYVDSDSDNPGLATPSTIRSELEVSQGDAIPSVEALSHESHRPAITIPSDEAGSTASLGGSPQDTRSASESGVTLYMMPYIEEVTVAEGVPVPVTVEPESRDESKAQGAMDLLWEWQENISQTATPEISCDPSKGVAFLLSHATGAFSKKWKQKLEAKYSKEMGSSKNKPDIRLVDSETMQEMVKINEEATDYSPLDMAVYDAQVKDKWDRTRLVKHKVVDGRDLFLIEGDPKTTMDSPWDRIDDSLAQLKAPTLVARIMGSDVSASSSGLNDLLSPKLGLSTLPGHVQENSPLWGRDASFASNLIQSTAECLEMLEALSGLSNSMKELNSKMEKLLGEGNHLE